MFNFDFITMADSASSGLGFFGFLSPLYWLFGKAMQALLFAFDNRYFLALIVFTVLTRAVLFPLNLKQQKTMAKTTRLQPKIQKIQKKYSNSKDPRDRQKMNEEMQALYQREGHNPMNMGCGPMVFQMIFLMGIIGIIYSPIQYLLGATEISDAANQKTIMDIIQPIYGGIIGDSSAKINYFQLNIIENFDAYRAPLTEALPNLFTKELCADIETFRSHLTLFGIDMTALPTLKGGAIVLIPILSFLTALGSSIVSTIIQKKNNPAAGQQQSQMMIMMLMMPVFSLYIAFKVPAAVGFYWIISNLVAIAQQLVMAKFFPPKKNIAHSMIESTIERRAREASIKKVKG